jgi:hypothetical protein
MFTGAGILVVELYKSNPVVVLFGFNKMNFSDPGGLLNMGEPTEIGACRECREESANLINIQPNELLHYGMPIISGSYMSYIIYVQNLRATDYIHNVNHIFRSCTDSSWKETNTITRIPLFDIINAANNYHTYANDIYGLVCSVRGRTMGLIRRGAQILASLINVTPILLQKNFVTHSRMPCLIGTYSYTIIHGQSQQNNWILSQSNLNSSINPKKYAIYIVPNDVISLHCDKSKSLHVTISGFSDRYDYRTIRDIVTSLVNRYMTIGKKWEMNVKTIKIKHDTIYFKSKTIDKIAKYLYDNKIKKVKGPEYTNTGWHITFNCDIPNDIVNILKKMKWSLCIVSMDNGGIKIYDKYDVRDI